MLFRSVDAYREYLDGLRALNSWRLRAADSAFARAIAIDSTFALAYYKRSVAVGWQLGSDSTKSILADKAVTYIDRLPPRLQELVRGHSELNRGFTAMERGDTAAIAPNFLAARARLARLVASDSTDAEAWYALGDADYHLALGSSYGRSVDSIAKYLTESLHGFTRTIQLDSTFHLAYEHLVQMYNTAASPQSYVLLVGDTLKAGGTPANERKVGTPEQINALREKAQTRGRVAAMGWVASDPDAPDARRVLAEGYATSGQPDSAIAVWREALKRPATADPTFEWQIPLLKAREGMPSAGPELKAVMKRFSVDSVKTFGMALRLSALMASMSAGAQTGMPSIIDDASTLMVKSTPMFPAYGTNMPTAYIANWYQNSLKVGMGLPMTSAVRSGLLGAIKGMSQLPPAVRDYSSPYLVYLATRDTLFGNTALRWAAASAPLPELTAHLAITKGDSATALKIAKTFPTPDSLRHARLGLNGMRSVARAEVLAMLGNTRQAVETYETIQPVNMSRLNPDIGWPMYVRSFVARGRLYEQLGEREKAVASYEKFLALWADAEAPMQPQLREAREAIARIKDSKADAKSVPVKGAVSPGAKGGR